MNKLLFLALVVALLVAGCVSQPASPGQNAEATSSPQILAATASPTVEAEDSPPALPSEELDEEDSAAAVEDFSEDDFPILDEEPAEEAENASESAPGELPPLP